MKDLDWDLFDRYLAGEATVAEREEFERWLAEQPERLAVLVAWRGALETLENEVAASDRRAVWSGALEQVGTGPSGPLARPRWRVAAAVAAAAVLAIVGAL